jgi:oxepin-CoA hydrolase/3-oxo-5,6-dehydrosuberyl-CoA semialdehyde dehydrogenase
MEQIPFDVNNLEIRQHFLNHTLMEAIDRLTEQTQPRWGRMTVQQMVEHLTWAFALSTGKSVIICNLLPDLQENRKKFLFNNEPTPREVPNPELEKGLPPIRFANLAKAKKMLGEEVNVFLKNVTENPSLTHDHPIFGKLSLEEWERAHYKHGYHHLLQFGLIRGPDRNE